LALLLPVLRHLIDRARSPKEELLGSILLYHLMGEAGESVAFSSEVKFAFEYRGSPRAAMLLMEDAFSRVEDPQEAREMAELLFQAARQSPSFLGYSPSFPNRGEVRRFFLPMRASMLRNDSLARFGVGFLFPMNERERDAINGILSKLRDLGALPEDPVKRFSIYDLLQRPGILNEELDHRIVEEALAAPEGFQGWMREDRRWIGELERGGQVSTYKL